MSEPKDYSNGGSYDYSEGPPIEPEEPEQIDWRARALEAVEQIMEPQTAAWARAVVFTMLSVDGSMSYVVQMLESFLGNKEPTERELLIARKVIGGFGRSLILILDEVNEPFDKARALRNLAADMKKFAEGGPLNV